MDKHSVLSCVKLYKNILDKYHIILSEEDLHNIYDLIALVFELDDLYDVLGKSPNPHQLDQIKTAMIALMPNNHPIGLSAIELVFQAMKDESLLEFSLYLTEYLKVSSKSIGAPIITGYLASKFCLEPSVWSSKTIVKFNDQINCLIRLANDYLDLTIDRKRMLQEVPQVKAQNFFKSKFQFKCYLIYRYVFHKIDYFICWIRFKYLKLSYSWKDYWQAILCSESVLDWAFKVYIIERRSCQ